MTTQSGVSRGVQQKGQKYWVKVPAGNGREISFTDPGEAADWLRDAKAARKQNDAMPPEPTQGTMQRRSAMSFADYADAVWWPAYLHLGNLESTNATTRRHLARICTASWVKKAITSIREKDVRDWADSLSAIEKRTTIPKQLWIVWSVFDAAFDDRACALQGNPAKGLKPRQSRLERQRTRRHERKALPMDVASVLVQRLRPNSRLVFGLEVLLGLRGGECFGIAVGSYEAASGAEPGWVSITRQWSDRPHGAADAGHVTRLVDWTKTLYSERTLPVPGLVDAAIREHVIRNYGHDFGDPWWDEPCADAWDPAIVLNRDLPLVCPAAGPGASPSRAGQYREELARVAEALDIDLRTWPDDDLGPLVPHDLRKAFATHLRDAGARPAAISDFLGHLRRAVEGEAKVTAVVYSPSTRRRLLSIVELCERELVPLVGPIITSRPGTGDDELLPMCNALDRLGHPFGVRALRRLVAEASVPRHFDPWGATTRQTYYRLGDLRALVASADGEAVIATPEASELLFPEVADDTQRRHALYRECLLGSVTRARQGHYTRSSVIALLERFAEIDAGSWVTASDFVAAAAAEPNSCGVEVFECTRGRYVPAAAVAAAARNRALPHALAARTLQLDEQTYWAVLRAADRGWANEAAAEPLGSLPGDRFRELHDRLPELKALAQLSALTRFTDAGDWIAIDEACVAMDSDREYLLDLAMRRGNPVGTRGRDLYLRREDVGVDGDGSHVVTLDALAALLDVSQERAAALAAERGWRSGIRSDRGQMVGLAQVRATFAELMTGERPVLATVARAAQLLGVSQATVRQRLRRADGVRVFARPPASWVIGRKGPAHVLVLVVQYEDALPPGYVAVAEAAAEVGVTLGAVTQWAQRVRAPVAVQRGRGRKWYVERSAARARFGQTAPEGWLRFRDLVAGTCLGSQSVRDGLIQLVAAGVVDGVKVIEERVYWYFAPEVRDRLPELLPGRAALSNGEACPTGVPVEKTAC